MANAIYRPAFVSALAVLGRICRVASCRVVPPAPPVLVGGAVVEFDTGGRFMSGDFDFVTVSDAAFEDALREAGFVRDARPGVLQRQGGWRHPALCIGIDMVSGTLFDGRADRDRLRFVAVEDGEVCMAATEDMIADRIGQWDASGRKDLKMLAQAHAMLTLADRLDPTYLDRRLKDETAGTVDLAALLQHVKGLPVDDPHHPPGA